MPSQDRLHTRGGGNRDEMRRKRKILRTKHNDKIGIKPCINQDNPQRMEKAGKDVMGSNDKRELRQGPRPSITINIWSLPSDTLFVNRGTEMLSK